MPYQTHFSCTDSSALVVHISYNNNELSPKLSTARSQMSITATLPDLFDGKNSTTNIFNNIHRKYSTDYMVVEW